MYKKMLAKNLKELRKSLGYRQQDMADVLKLKRATYAKMETGVTYGSIETLVEIFELFGVSVEKLFGLEKDVLHFRYTKNTIREFDKVCRREGISREEAIELFVKTVIRENKLPAEIVNNKDNMHFQTP